MTHSTQSKIYYGQIFLLSRQIDRFQNGRPPRNRHFNKRLVVLLIEVYFSVTVFPDFKSFLEYKVTVKKSGNSLIIEMKIYEVS